MTMTPIFALLGQEHPDLVVGIDICGDPHRPTVTPYLLPALKVANLRTYVVVERWRLHSEISWGPSWAKFMQTIFIHFA